MRAVHIIDPAISFLCHLSKLNTLSVFFSLFLIIFLCEMQDSYRFGQHIWKAMLDIEALFKAKNYKKTVEHANHVQLENGKKHM